MKHGRLPWYDPETLDPASRRLYDAILAGPRGQGVQIVPLCDDGGRLYGPFNALLAAPDIGSAVQDVGRRIRYDGALSGREREIAILELAALRTSAFEWYAHERLGRHAGLTEDEIVALRDGADAPTFAARETLVRATVRELVLTRDISDARYDEAERILGSSLVVELVLLTGYYDLVALSLRAFRTPLPADANDA